MLLLKKYEPLLLFLLIIPVLILRVNIESTHYCTPDSDYYLEVSRNILSGQGFTGPKVFDFDEKKHQLIPLYHQTPFGHPELYQKEFFAVWPLGYPVGIVTVSKLTSLEPLWASKVLNILLLGLDFYLIWLFFSGSTNLPLYYFGSYTMLEICSYTWSENLFLTFFLLFIVALKKIHDSDSCSWKRTVLLSMALAGMVLTRYASVIFYVAAFAIMLWYSHKKEWIKMKSIFTGLVLGGLGIAAYLFNNYLQSGYFTGMPRVDTQDFTSVELVKRFFLGIFNQLHIIKQFRFSGKADFALYLLLTWLQLAMMLLLAWQLKTSVQKPFSKKNKVLICLGICYLVFLIYMTFTSTIDPFDYRTLTPFSFPVFIALLAEAEERLKSNQSVKTILALKVFFIFSLLMNLPKKFLIELLG